MFWRRSVADQVEEELDFHLEMVTRDLIAHGWHDPDARAEARRRGHTDLPVADPEGLAGQAHLASDVRAAHAIPAVERLENECTVVTTRVLGPDPSAGPHCGGAGLRSRRACTSELSCSGAGGRLTRLFSRHG